MSLFDYFVLVWRYRWMIAGLFLLAAGGAVTVTLHQPRRYQAMATIVPPIDILQKQAGLGSQLSGLGGSLLGDVIGSRSIGDIYVEILASREIADAIISRFDLMHVYSKATCQSDVRKRLKHDTRIEATKGGSVRIAVTASDPNNAAAIANAYVEELDKQNKKLSVGQATSKRVFLENRLKEVEQKLSRIDNIPSREAEVQEMLYELLMRELEMAKIEEAKSMPTIQVLDKAIVPELPVERGVIRKGVLAGVAAILFGVFLAFIREYILQVRCREGSISQKLGSATLPAAESGAKTG